MVRGEVLFNGVSLHKKYGIAVEKCCRSLSPPLRERKVAIPNRDGKYNYGARNYDENTLTLECGIARRYSREQIRELAYTLSRRGRIELWDEPGKIYIGQLYDPEELEKIGESSGKFSLTFTCEPFAYGATVTLPIAAGLNRIEYKGTARTPTLIVLKNNSKTAAQNVRITAIFRRKTR